MTTTPDSPETRTDNSAVPAEDGTVADATTTPPPRARLNGWASERKAHARGSLIVGALLLAVLGFCGGVAVGSNSGGEQPPCCAPPAPVAGPQRHLADGHGMTKDERQKVRQWRKDRDQMRKRHGSDGLVRTPVTPGQKKDRPVDGTQAK